MTATRDLLIQETPLVIFDVESTGFYTADLRNEIIELTVIRREPGGRFELTFDSLFSIGRRAIPNSHIHHITSADLRGAPTFAEAAPLVAEALSGALWVAYNAPFDRNFVTATLKRDLGLELAPPFLCAQRLQKVLGLGKAGKLHATCEAFSVPFDEGQHVSFYDTWATARLMDVWLERMEHLGLKRFGELETLAKKSTFIDSLSAPLWSFHPEALSAPFNTANTKGVKLKSRYAQDLGLPTHTRSFPPLGEAPQEPPSQEPPSQELPSQEPPSQESRFSLRPYQDDAIEAILTRRRKGVTRQVVCLPTGAGKTVIFSELARLATRRVLVLAHREELLTQAKEKLERALSDLTAAQGEGAVKVEIEQGAHTASSEAKVVVASLRSLRSERLARLLSEGGAEGFGLVIYDECHHAVAEDNKRILTELGVFEPSFQGTLVGFTATTRRADGLGLDEVFEEVVYSRSLLDMLRDGYLVPVRGYRIDTSVSLEGVGGRGDFIADELAERVDIQERNGLVAKSIQELARDRRTLCFCVTVHHAEQLAATLRALGVPAATVHGEMKPLERSTTLRDFREGALQVITNVGVLTEGFDDPEVSCVAMARPTKSEALYVQCVGRGMRLFEGKKDCIVLDFVDTSALNLVTLPSLVGVPIEVDFEGREVTEAAGAYHALFEEHLGFEWEAERLTLSELQERARAFDPLHIKLSPEVRAISQNGWVSLGQRGVALHFSRDGRDFSELLILSTSEPGKQRYVLLLDDVEVGRARSVEEGVEAADFEVGRMGRWATETAPHDAPWRLSPAPPEALEPLRSLPFPRPPQTLEEVFRAITYVKLFG